ncbi:MAG: class I SAM-dependent methyltransferase [Planctomycetota bacterium]|nr:class I SAM-dependent methyltransferase [Planctomycetota bacterium]
MTELQVIGGSRSHDTLRRVLSQRPPVKVLDCPAGTGVLSEFLRDLGWDVHCADIDPGNFEAEGFPFEEANLNRGLPHEDESFDAVLCANGLHRLYHPVGAIEEFFRVLRPGGSLYININNYASIQKRLRFLFYGSITNTINESSFKQTSSDPEANVRHHLFYPQLANHLEATGFKIVDLQPASVKTSHRLLWPFALLIKLASFLVNPASRKRNKLSSTNSRGICPGGKYFYVEAIKTAKP